MSAADGLVRQINVEIDSLRQIAAHLRAELESGFRSQIPPVQGALRAGAGIGGPIAGAEWAQLRATYLGCLDSTLTALESLDRGTSAVARAAAVIADTYGDADALSRARAEQVHEVIAAPAPRAEQYGPYQPRGAGDE